MNSMILHELFFDGLGDESEPEPRLKDALARDFGSYERWRAEFIAMGKALGGGSGWVLLTWSPRDRKLVNQWASDHCHTLAGGNADPGARYVRALLSHRLSAPRRPTMSASSWRPSVGPPSNGSTRISEMMLSCSRWRTRRVRERTCRRRKPVKNQEDSQCV